MLDAGTEAPIPETYHELADKTPWLWPLRTLTPTDIRDHLTADIEIAQLQSISFGWRARENFRFYSQMALGLEQALENIDLLTREGPVTGQQADAFIIAQVTEWSPDDQDQKRQAQIAAVDAFDTTGQSDEELRENDAYQALRNEAGRARYAWSASGSVLSELRIAKFDVARIEEFLAFDHDLAPLAHVIPIQTQTAQFVPNVNSGVTTGPATSGGLSEIMQRITDSATGHQRNPSRQTLRQSCGLGLTSDGAIEPMCEAAYVLPINYDLTALGCDDLTLGQANLDAMGMAVGTALFAHQACKEGWSFPQFNVVFGPG